MENSDITETLAFTMGNEFLSASTIVKVSGANAVGNTDIKFNATTPVDEATIQIS